VRGWSAANSPYVEVDLHVWHAAAVNRTSMAIVAAFFGAAFAISGIVRGEAAPGVVGGLLGAAVVYLVLNRVHEHNETIRRRREREGR
jgi:L-lactate permease